MSLLPLFVWLGHSWVGALMQSSTWGFAGVEMVHLFGLALLGGASLVINLRVLGFLMPHQPLSALARGLARVLFGGLATLVVSGVLLIADGPLRYYSNVAFRTKMLLLLAAAALGFFVYRAAARPASAETISVGMRLASALSLVLWLGVGLAGRAIGLL